MSVKKILCLTMGLILLLSATACKKADDDLSSNYAYSSTITDIYQETESDNSNENVTSSKATQSSTVSTASPNHTTSNGKNEKNENINIKEKYGFNSITSVEYSYIKDIPYGDAEYKVTDVLTDTGLNMNYAVKITCKSKDIIINENTVTIPYKYKKNNDYVALTATHVASGESYDFKINLDKWDLVFEDNFDGTALNTKIWNVWDHTDWQYFYSPDSIFLDGNGHLVNRVSVLDTPHPQYGYTRKSGAITTKDKYDSTYGYYEISMIPHLTTGFWGAFWMMAGDMGEDAADDNSSVNGAEIDVVETIFDTKIPSHAVHWDGYEHTKSWNIYGSLQPLPNVFDGKFHTFAVRWTPSEFIFLVDGNVTALTEAAGGCNQPAYMLISSHFGEWWAGALTLKAGEYSDMIVDYVRIYQTPSDKKSK